LAITGTDAQMGLPSGAPRAIIQEMTTDPPTAERHRDVRIPMRDSLMTVTACALVIVAGLVLLKGVYDWSGKPNQVAAQPLQHDRLIVYSAAAVMIVGAALFAIAGARTAALAIAVTADLPVLLILPASHRLSDTLVPCLVTVTVAAALAVRTVRVPQARVSPLAVAAFTVVIVAGSHMLAGLLDAVVSFDSSDET
jgi:hypothetical protein